MRTNAYGIFVGEIPTPTQHETTTERQLDYATSQRDRGNFRLRKAYFLSKRATSAKRLPKSIAQYSTRQTSRCDQIQADRKPFSISTNQRPRRVSADEICSALQQMSVKRVMLRKVIKWSRRFQSLFITTRSTF